MNQLYPRSLIFVVLASISFLSACHNSLNAQDTEIAYVDNTNQSEVDDTGQCSNDSDCGLGVCLSLFGGPAGCYERCDRVDCSARPGGGECVQAGPVGVCVTRSGARGDCGDGVQQLCDGASVCLTARGENRGTCTRVCDPQAPASCTTFAPGSAPCGCFEYETCENAGTLGNDGICVSETEIGNYCVPVLAPCSQGQTCDDNTCVANIVDPEPKPEPQPEPQPNALLLDENCIDGAWQERWPNREQDVSSIVQNFHGQNPVQNVVALLNARYPDGALYVNSALADTRYGNCFDIFYTPTTSGSDLVSQLSLLTHECGHFADLVGPANVNNDFFLVNSTTEFDCRRGETVARGGDTFANSLLADDQYQQDFPPCTSDQVTRQCDSYARTYLNGDENDGQHQSGDQGFDSLLEEAHQYVTSLATGYAFNDFYSRATSERDGVAAFMWYITRYLRLARTEHPLAYARISQDACWREMVLTTWGRAWRYLQRTEGMPMLGLNDDLYISRALNPELLEEIDRLRAFEGCSQ